MSYFSVRPPQKKALVHLRTAITLQSSVTLNGLNISFKTKSSLGEQANIRHHSYVLNAQKKNFFFAAHPGLTYFPPKRQIYKKSAVIKEEEEPTLLRAFPPSEFKCTLVHNVPCDQLTATCPCTPHTLHTRSHSSDPSGWRRGRVTR